jgi:hypothetical protein
MGPPDGWLGGSVPGRFVLGRGPEHLITLAGIEAFTTGVLFDLVVTTRVPVHRPGMFGMPSEGGMRFGVSFPDGSKWQGAQLFPPRPDQTPTPTPPNVWFSGGGGGGNQQRHHLWLWPLPPPGPVTFVLSWTDAGIAETSTVLDGAVVRTAADESEQLWDALTREQQHALMTEHFAGGRPGPPPGTGFTSTRLMTLGTRDEPPESPNAKN